jgi:hypothetical protein
MAGAQQLPRTSEVADPPPARAAGGLVLLLALLKGDPNESGVIKGAARQVLEKILPGSE